MLHDIMLENYGGYMSLNIFVDQSGTELKQLYQNAANSHRNKLVNDPAFIDAGFDLYAVPMSMPIQAHSELLKMDFKIVCSAQMVLDSGKTYNTGYYMYPRSSLSKTSLRLANSIGIIDAGYRGHLIGAFDVRAETFITGHDKLVQICAPGLKPIVVTVVDEIEDLGEQTRRGDGGFGSTGR